MIGARKMEKTGEKSTKKMFFTSKVHGYVDEEVICR